MTGQSEDPTEQLGEELRALLSAFITAVTPLVAQIAPDPSAPQSSCTWCPVCALAALARGEQHPLLTALGTQGVALLTALRDLLADSVDKHPEGHFPEGHDEDAAAEMGAGGITEDEGGTGTGRTDPAGSPVDTGSRPRFERIAVTVLSDPGQSFSNPGRSRDERNRR